MSNHHKTLGVQPTASKEEIKKAYRKLALEYHPDRGGDENKFKEITEAYEVLTGKRKDRNQPQHQPGFDPFAGFSPFGGFRNAPRRPKRPPNDDSGVGIGLNLSVDEIKRGRAFKFEYQKSKDCADCKGVGGDRKIKCSTCNGAGMIRETTQQGNMTFGYERPCDDCYATGERVENKCKTCKGNGFVVYSEKLEFEVKGK